MGHKQSDFDSFGASIAMYSICKAYGKKAHIIIDYDSLEEKTGVIARSLRDDERYRGVFITPARINEFNHSKTLLVNVDNHKPSLAIDANALDIIKNKVVIDHHRRGEEFIELPLLTYLEPAASSTVELIVELFDYQKENVCVTEREATIMYAGMLIDTNYFRTRVGTRTFQAAAKLKEMQANVSEAYKYLEDDYDTTLTKLSITQTAYRYGENILIAFGRQDKIYSRTLLAKAGNELLGISGVKAVFTVGRTGKEEVSISARSTRDVNVQLIMEKLGGGGHFSMAACQLKYEDVTIAINLLEEAINEYLDERTIMKVILLQDVKKVGKKGEVVKVADGYGQNFLIKNKLAVLETNTSRKIVESQKEAEHQQDLENQAKAKELAKEIESITLEFTLKSGKDGKTFGSVSTKQVVEQLREKYGIKIDKRKFIDAHPIGALGYTKLKVELYKGIIATINVHLKEQ